MMQNQSEENAEKLESLAEVRFRRKQRPERPFTRAEQALLKNAPVGEMAYANARSHDVTDPTNDPGKAEKTAGNPGWDAEREVDARLIRWLCLDREAAQQIDPAGIQIQGARLTGVLDLSHATVPLPIYLQNCAFAADAEFSQAEIPELNLTGSWSKSINAERVIVKAGVFLKSGFHADGEVRLPGARIGGNLECDGSSLKNLRGYALFADAAEVSGYVFLRNKFSAQGEVNLLNARIGKDLDCEGSTFNNPKGSALTASGVTVGGGVYLYNMFDDQGSLLAKFTAQGTVDLVGARIGGTLNCDGGSFNNSGGSALDAERAEVSGCVFLRNKFSAQGKVNLLHAQIGANLECDGGTFYNPGTCALNADSIDVKKSVFLRDKFSAQGEVTVAAAQIGGNLECEGGTFNNPKGSALTASGITVGGDVLLYKELDAQGSLLARFTAQGKVDLAGAHIGGTLNCDGGSFNNSGDYALDAERADVKGAVFLRNNFSAQGEVSVAVAQIGGNFECQGSTFNNPEGSALTASGVKVGGDAFLCSTFDPQGSLLAKFSAQGEINLAGAHIGGSLDCEGSTFSNRGKDALSADGIDVKRSIFLRNKFSAEGEVSLLYAQIGETLDCEAGTFNNPGKRALSADGVDVKGGAFLDNRFNAQGEVSVAAAQIGGNLECEGGTFNNPKGSALAASGVKVGGDVYLYSTFDDQGALLAKFTAQGEVSLVGARIGGTLNCDAGSINSPGGSALDAERAEVRGYVFLRNKFSAQGRVNLLHAQIGANLECDSGTFSNLDDMALIVERVSVKGNVFLREGFNARGTVSLLDAHIDGDLNLNRGMFTEATLDLTDASASALRDTETAWPQPAKLLLDGFVYGRIAEGPTKAGDLLKWLALQPQAPLATQPYLQLAKVLREAGDDAGAVSILERMEERRRQQADQRRPDRKVASWLFGEFAGYGYDPASSVLAIAAVSGIGWIIYRRSHLAGGMVPTEKDACRDFKYDGEVPSRYETFSPLVYSIENSLPLVKLGQADKWEPDPEPDPASSRKRKWIKSAGREKSWPGPFRWLERLLIFTGLLGPINLNERPSSFSRFGTSPRFLRWFLWAQILLGWLLATLLVAGVTGIIRKD